MKLHSVRVHPERDQLPPEHQLAWKLAAAAAERTDIAPEVADMIINRVIDNAAVALAALNRPAVVSARAQALAHRRDKGATLFGLGTDRRVHAEWAAWANGTAVRELDFHDTFLGEEYSHPADNIPALIAVAQQKGCSGADVLAGIAVAYELQIDLAKAISLHKHKIDHIAHLGVSVAGGIGALLSLPVEVIYQAIQHALHVTTTTRQSRKGAISSWKAYAPAHAGKLGIEAIDRAMRGETSPSPIYEGEDGIIAWMLDGPDSHYEVPLPDPGEAKRAILESYTKEHSAEYQAQALIDLAFKMGKDIHDWDRIKDIKIHTSHHTHYVIGSGANDPQKYDPAASRETLDHSIMYIFAVALQDGTWDHVRSYLPERAGRSDTVALWKKIRTIEDPVWSQRYHAADTKMRAFGGRVEITYEDGTVVSDELALANAHPLGARPFGRADYIKKFVKLTEGLITPEEQNRFLDLVQRLGDLKPEELGLLTLSVPADKIEASSREGIF